MGPALDPQEEGDMESPKRGEESTDANKSFRATRRPSYVFGGELVLTVEARAEVAMGYLVAMFGTGRGPELEPDQCLCNTFYVLYNQHFSLDIPGMINDHASVSRPWNHAHGRS